MTATPQDINDAAKEILRRNYEFETEPPFGNALRITELDAEVQNKLIQLGKITSNDADCVGTVLREILLQYRKNGKCAIRELGRSLFFWKKRGNETNVLLSDFNSCPDASVSPQAAPEAISVPRGSIALAAGGQVRGRTVEASSSATKKKTPKIAATKKAVPKKAAPKKTKAVTAAKKAVAKKAVTKKAVTKKTVTKKTVTKKTVGKKTVGKKSVSKQTSAKKLAPKKPATRMKISGK